ncbi:sodium-dependent nutrient amino acid transporter 1-like isoform X1 [Maniola hyperantus]|uniref:sodium-dependent nutrient amino acid transporter 1-like isoform X1 n=2 Tax=Aphantopus hyperantus TaxID=2795564 RepID=UPI0015694F8A|nr:sodium-dependent nutrient amino acid transporter 1-like isoform X2 [Maniola hyperantus]
MAVVNRPFGVVPSARDDSRQARTPRHGRTVRRVFDVFKTQVCTIAISFTLFNSVRLPREAFKYGDIPYLVIYSFWLLVVALPTTLLQLAIGQLSHQDPVGVWRAVPILRGVGHLKILTSYVCCIYSMVYIALSAAYMIWIGKGTFPLKDCTKVHMTPNGYENKMNASECFNSTFLAPFTEQPQYLGVMAILIFVLWFFVPIMLYRLHKSLRISLVILAPIIIIVAIILTVFLSDINTLSNMLESCEHWMPLSQPYIWHSTLVQALLSTQIVSGYLISAGGSLYRHSDVRWTSTFVTITNLLSGWLSVFLWQSIGGEGVKDTSFIAILVLIYQSSVSEKRSKEWPLLAFALVLVSGIITVLSLLFPIYDKLHRIAGDYWRIFACASSALGTALTVSVLAQGLDLAAVLDELVIPVLAVFTTIVEIVGFVFIYGWYYLTVDIHFVTGSRLPCFWLVTWWSTPVLLMGVTGWWLRSLLRVTWGEGQTLWPLGGVFIGILVVMVVMAAVAVAKEEQFNLLTKIASAFRPSRLWGPEEPMARYIWMSQRFINENGSDQEFPTDTKTFKHIINKYHDKCNEIYNEDWLHTTDIYQNSPKAQTKSDLLKNENPLYNNVGAIYSIPTVSSSKRKKKGEEQFRSPNVCIAKDELGGPVNCNCNRHFQLNVPDLRNNEVSTSL